MIVATMLDVLKARASTNPKALYLDQTYQTIPDLVEKHKSRPIKLPRAELDHPTHERRRVRQKKSSGNVNIEMPSEVQTIKSYVESFQHEHWGWQAT